MKRFWVSDHILIFFSKKSKKNIKNYLTRSAPKLFTMCKYEFLAKFHAEGINMPQITVSIIFLGRASILSIEYEYRHQFLNIVTNNRPEGAVSYYLSTQYPYYE